MEVRDIKLRSRSSTNILLVSWLLAFLGVEVLKKILSINNVEPNDSNGWIKMGARQAGLKNKIHV